MDAAAGASSTVSPGRGQGGGGPGRPGHAAHACVGVLPVVAHRPIVTPAHVEDGDLGGVSRQRGVDAVPVAAQDDGPGEPVAVGDDELADVGALEQAARHPDDAGVRGEGRGGGVRVGRLRVVDPPDPAGLGHHGPAVRAGGDRAQTGGDRLGRHPVRAGQGGRGQGVQLPGRAGRGDVGDRRERHGVGERPVHEVPVDDPQLARAGLAAGEADVARRRRGDQQRGGLAVVEARDRDVTAQHPGLRGAVGGHRAVPVEVVLGEVEHRPGEGAHRRRPLELEARQLHRQHPVARAQRVHDGQPDVAAGDGVLPRRAQDRLEHRRRGGLAVGAGDREPARRPVRADRRVVAQPPGELRLADHRHRRRAGRQRQRRVGAEAGAGHHEVAPVGQRRELPGAGHRAVAEQVQLGLVAVGDRHPRPEVQQHVDDGDPGAPGPRDQHVPVVPGRHPPDAANHSL